MQTRRNQIWKESHRIYFTSQQVRKKWLNGSNNFSVKNLVLVADDNCRVSDWPLAGITKLFKGNDTRTRGVEVEAAKGVSNRPIVKLRKLFHKRNSTHFILMLAIIITCQSGVIYLIAFLFCLVVLSTLALKATSS